MVRTIHVLVASACFMLATSVVVAAVALIFHPTKSETAKLVAELRPKLQRALCEANLEKDETKCEKSAQSSPKSVDDVTSDPGCELTKARNETITKAVNKEFEDGKTEILLGHLQKAVHHIRNGSGVLTMMENLSLNVPRPSAHWFMKHFQIKAGEQHISWVWQPSRNAKHAHSQNGIRPEGGRMRIEKKGWYHVYFQIDFKTNVSMKEAKRFETEIKAEGDGPYKKKTLMSVSEESMCQRKHATPHPCVVLKKSGIFRLLDNDLLSVRLVFPDEAAVDMGSSRSYFGAYYVRGDSVSTS